MFCKMVRNYVSAWLAYSFTNVYSKFKYTYAQRKNISIKIEMKWNWNVVIKTILLSLFVSKTLRDFQTWIKTRPHLPSAAPSHVIVGIKQKTLKLDRTFVALSLSRNITHCINIIIISQDPFALTLTCMLYLYVCI